LKDNLTRIEETIRIASAQIRKLREENSNLKLKLESFEKELEELKGGKVAAVHQFPVDWQRDKREIRKRIEMIREQISVLEETPLGKSN
jgi:predicted RNase H-like nuclease (RuvC/YqgF family)